MTYKMLCIKIVRAVLSTALSVLMKAILPRATPFLAGMRRLSVGDTVLWRNVGNFLVIERRGSAFRYKYKLLDTQGINPWLLPALSLSPGAEGNAPVCWYRATRGRCYLKKTGHPKFEFKMAIVSRAL